MPQIRPFADTVHFEGYYLLFHFLFIYFKTHMYSVIVIQVVRVGEIGSGKNLVNLGLRNAS